jgi:hypothetical protein
LKKKFADLFLHSGVQTPGYSDLPRQKMWKEKDFLQRKSEDCQEGKRFRAAR